MNFQEPRETLPSSKSTSLSERLITCTVMNRIKPATFVFKKKNKIPALTLFQRLVRAESTEMVHREFLQP